MLDVSVLALVAVPSELPTVSTDCTDPDLYETISETRTSNRTIYLRLPVFDPEGCLAGQPILVCETASGSWRLRPLPLLAAYPPFTFMPCCACCSNMTSAFLI